MVPFEIEIACNNRPVSVQVEQLDYLAGENGRMRYDLRSETRQAILSVDMEADPGDPGFTFEAVQAFDEPFNGDELLAIIKAIRAFNQQQRFPFSRLPFH